MACPIFVGSTRRRTLNPPFFTNWSFSISFLSVMVPSLVVSLLAMSIAAIQLLLFTPNFGFSSPGKVKAVKSPKSSSMVFPLSPPSLAVRTVTIPKLPVTIHLDPSTLPFLTDIRTEAVTSSGSTPHSCNFSSTGSLPEPVTTSFLSSSTVRAVAPEVSKAPILKICFGY